jgi:hypothetical protein
VTCRLRAVPVELAPISVYARPTDAAGLYAFGLDVVRRDDLVVVATFDIGTEIFVHQAPILLPSAGSYDVEGGKYVKVKITGNRIEVWPGPECTFREPEPGRPIPPKTSDRSATVTPRFELISTELRSSKCASPRWRHCHLGL